MLSVYEQDNVEEAYNTGDCPEKVGSQHWQQCKNAIAFFHNQSTPFFHHNVSRWAEFYRRQKTNIIFIVLFPKIKLWSSAPPLKRAMAYKRFCTTLRSIVKYIWIVSFNTHILFEIKNVRIAHPYSTRRGTSLLPPSSGAAMMAINFYVLCCKPTCQILTSLLKTLVATWLPFM